jgi:hypothetical protein
MRGGNERGWRKIQTLFTNASLFFRDSAGNSGGEVAAV